MYEVFNTSQLAAQALPKDPAAGKAPHWGCMHGNFMVKFHSFARKMTEWCGLLLDRLAL